MSATPFTPEPGYYRTDMGRLTFGELRRMAPGGPIVAALFYLFRKRLPMTPEGPFIPLLWDDLVVEHGELSYACQLALQPPVAALEARGFRVVAHQLLRDHLFPLQTDNGAAYLLHASGAFAANALWTRARNPEPLEGETTTTVVSIFTACPSGKVVSVGDSRMYMDPPAPREVVSLPGAGVDALWKRAQAERKRLDGQGERALPLRTVEDLAFHHDAQELLSWQDRIQRRGVLVRMSDAEVGAARQRMPAPR